MARGSRARAWPGAVVAGAWGARAGRGRAGVAFGVPGRSARPVAAGWARAARKEARPKVGFGEGPAEANHLVEHVLHTKTKPPIAIYNSYRDDGNILGLAGVARASQLQLAQPLLTITWSALLLDQHVGPGALAVAAIVIACVLVTQRARITAVGVDSPILRQAPSPAA